ncbi:hypothetical protein [Geoglobus sp.]
MKSKLIAGGVTAFLGSVIALEGALNGNQSMINAGIGGIFLGVVLMTFSTSEYVKADALAAAITSHQELARKLVRSLEIENSAVYIPPYENLESGGLYIPLHRDFQLNLAALDEDVVFLTDAGREKEMGLVLPVPGKDLVRMFEEYSETEISGLDIYAVESSSSVLRSLGLAKSVSADMSEEEIRVYVDDVKYRDLCSESCRQIPCPVCGSVLLAIAKGLNELIQVESVEFDNRGVVFTARKLGSVEKWM